MSKTRVLTGITTSGTPHLGNYAGAIRPAIAASRAPGVESFYFLADYHALIKVQEPARVQRSTLEIAATWLACGLDVEHNWFYRQSDIPEIPELTWLLTCVAGKGLLNRAHAYKAAVDKNRAEGEDDDAGINAGLFMYPVLMAADILLFNAHKVPVGRDQVQHIEMARDFGQRFNHLYGEHFTLPEAVIEEQVATLPGLDGRKMSKSYGNTLPIFGEEKPLRKTIMRITTDSTPVEDPKPTADSTILALYKLFASEADYQTMIADHERGGIGYGDFKKRLADAYWDFFAPMRARRAEILADPGYVDKVLADGATRAREEAGKVLTRVRRAVGLI
jgi:tryptophanyl-tRNA synthetase